MKLYTKTQIIEDIEDFEGIQIDTSDVHDAWLYSKLYSDVNSKSSSSMTVDDFTNKVMGFMNEYACIPSPDILPSDEYVAVIYTVENHDDVKTICSKMRFQCRTFDELKEITPTIPGESMIIVYPKDSSFMHFKRNLH